MKLTVIDKYVSWELFRSFVSSLTFFTALLLVVRFSEKEIGTFISKNMSLSESLKSLAFQVPGFVIQVIPPSMLFATFFSLGRMAQNNEITAMKSSGISLYRVFLPVFVIAFVITLFMIVFSDQVVTWATGKDIDIKRLSARASQTARDIVFMTSGGRTFYIDFISLRDRHMENVTMYELDESGNVRHEIYASVVSWSGEVWHFKKGVERTFLQRSSNDERGWEEKPYELKEIIVPEDPEIMIKGAQSLQRMSLAELSKLIKYKKRTGQVVRKELVTFHDRLSFPFACFVMALLGAPMFVVFGRSGIAVGFLLTLFISFLYWGVAIATFEAFGNNGKLSPALSCWAANLLFAMVGVALVYKVKK